METTYTMLVQKMSLLIMSMFHIALLEIHVYKNYSQSCSIVLKSWKMGGEGTSQMKKY